MEMSNGKPAIAFILLFMYSSVVPRVEYRKDRLADFEVITNLTAFKSALNMSTSRENFS